MKTSIDAYMADPRHRIWGQHYGHYHGVAEDCVRLLFTPAWAAANLPPFQPSHRPMRVVLLDSEDGKLYETRMCCSLEPIERDSFPPDWLDEPVRSLSYHFYYNHHCPCHRKAAAGSAGADTDAECEGDRFLIERIEHPDLPGLILYSETFSAEQLEPMLRAAEAAK